MPSSRVAGKRALRETRARKALGDKCSGSLRIGNPSRELERWGRFNGHELVADVLDGVKFKNGIKVTEDDHDEEKTDERVAA